MNVASSKQLHLLANNNNVLPVLPLEGQHFSVLRFAVSLSLCLEGQHQCLLLSLHLSVLKDNTNVYRNLSISLFYKKHQRLLLSLHLSVLKDNTNVYCCLYICLSWRTTPTFTVACLPLCSLRQRQRLLFFSLFWRTTTSFTVFLSICPSASSRTEQQKNRQQKKDTLPNFFFRFVATFLCSRIWRI